MDGLIFVVLFCVCVFFFFGSVFLFTLHHGAYNEKLEKKDNIKLIWSFSWLPITAHLICCHSKAD